jgi:hypothetical protein
MLVSCSSIRIECNSFEWAVLILFSLHLSNMFLLSYPVPLLAVVNVDVVNVVVVVVNVVDDDDGTSFLVMGCAFQYKQRTIVPFHSIRIPLTQSIGNTHRHTEREIR